MNIISHYSRTKLLQMQRPDPLIQWKRNMEGHSMFAQYTFPSYLLLVLQDYEWHKMRMTSQWKSSWKLNYCNFVKKIAIEVRHQSLKKFENDNNDDYDGYEWHCSFVGDDNDNDWFTYCCCCCLFWLWKMDWNYKLNETLIRYTQSVTIIWNMTSFFIEVGWMVEEVVGGYFSFYFRKTNNNFRFFGWTTYGSVFVHVSFFSFFLLHVSLFWHIALHFIISSTTFYCPPVCRFC